MLDRPLEFPDTTEPVRALDVADTKLVEVLLGDAQDEAFDTAIIISGYGDLASPGTGRQGAKSRTAGHCRIPAREALSRSSQRSGEAFDYR